MAEMAGSPGAGSARPAGRQPRLRRARGRDPLGLRRVMADRLLPLLVAAMALLAALALAGAEGVATVAARWQAGAAASVALTLPSGTAPARVEAVLGALRAMPEVAEARRMDQARLAGLLEPWLGEAAAPAVPLPVVVELRLHGLPTQPAALARRIAVAAPEGRVEAHGVWVARLLALARSLQALAFATLALVAGLAAAIVGVAVRAGIAARREAIGVLHDLGATDGDIAGRFARRAAFLTGLGGLLGTLAALPVLAGLAMLAAPLVSGGGEAEASPELVPGLLGGLAVLPWPGLVLLAPLAALLGWTAAQVTVRLWLRRLP